MTDAAEYEENPAQSAETGSKPLIFEPLAGASMKIAPVGPGGTAQAEPCWRCGVEQPLGAGFGLCPACAALEKGEVSPGNNPVPVLESIAGTLEGVARLRSDGRAPIPGDVDVPEGALMIQISDTLAREWAAKLRKIAPETAAACTAHSLALASGYTYRYDFVPAPVATGKPIEGGDPTLGDRPRLEEGAAQMAQLVSLAKTRPLSARDQAEELLIAALRDCAACLNDAGRQAVSDLLFAFDAVRKEDA